jgi:DNA repair exonuclease SbcCD ATPase subunit
MIKRAIIWYQRHVGSVFNFHPGVNTIIGDTDAGKTSVILALDWVRTNRPSTKRMIPRGQKRAKVILDLDPGETVTRLRGKSAGKNYYRLGKEKFDAVGRDVPEEITKVLNLSDLNFHIHGSFLIHMTAPARAKYINELVNLDIIDTTRTNIHRIVEDVKGKKTKTEEDIEELRESIAELTWVKDAKGDLKKLEGLYEQIVNTGKRHQALQKLIDDYYEAKLALEKLPKPIPDKTVRALESLLEKIQTTSEKVEQLRRLITDARTYWNVIQEADGLITEYQKEFDKLMKGRCPLCGQEVRK